MGSELTPEQINRAGELAVFIVAAILLSIGLLSMGYGRVMDWYYGTIMSSAGDGAGGESSPNNGVATTSESSLQPVVKPTTPINDELQIAEEATLQCLARLYIESRRKAFQNGMVPETRGLETVFGCSRTSAPDSEYQRLLGLFRAEVARLSPSNQPAFRPIDEHSRPVLTTKVPDRVEQ